MKRKWFLKAGMVLLAVLLAVSFAISCGGSGGGDDEEEDSSQKSTNSQLSTLTIAGKTQTPGTAVNALGSLGGATAGTISLSNSLKPNAKVIAKPVNNKATVTFAYKTGSAVPAAADFIATDTYTFADSDYFYIKVSAESGEHFSYYKFKVEIGRDATLEKVTIGGVDATSLGKPKVNTWSAFASGDRGSWQADEPQMPEGFTVEITPNDEDATVVWAGGLYATTAEPAAWDGTSPYIFPGGQSYIVIKVTSGGGGVINYYSLQIISKNSADINYGTPKLTDPSNSSNIQYIDPIWDDEPWLEIDRVNRAESFDAWFATAAGQHTSGKAKVLWDDDGLWVYCDVDFKDYNNGADQVRTASRSDVASTFSPGTDTTDTNNHAPDGAHTRDSLEIFINERYQAYKAGNYGNQYRVGLPNKTDNTVYLSGEKGNPPSDPYLNSIIQFQIDGGNCRDSGTFVRSWVKTTAAKETGYVVIARARWIKRYGADVSQVFAADGKVIPGAKVGLELQINACATEGTRNGILTWNGVTSQAYQNVKSFGIVTLVKTP